MDQFIVFFVALVEGGGPSLKKHQHFEEHIPVDIWFGESVIFNDNKDIWTNQFEVRKYQAKVIKSKNE